MPPPQALVREPRAGVLFPEECILAHLEQAARAGAELHYEEPVLAWSAAPHAVEVQTSRGHYEAGALVITAGPWAPQGLEEVGLPLAGERQVVGWFRPVDLQAAFDPGSCPVHVWQVDGRFFYGFPRLGDEGVKIAERKTGHPTPAATACGVSGHGFKFAPVVGEILADLALLGRTEHDISLFALDRFARG